MKSTLFLLLFFAINIANAQEKFTVSGTLKDKANGETLLGATVLFEGTNIGAATNEYGFYSLTAPKGDYTLVVSYVGYVSVEKPMSLTADVKFDAELQEDANQLEEVILTVEESKKVNLGRPQMSVSKLSANSIKQIPAVLGEVDVIKSIQLLPGVTNAGEGASGFNVRGGAEDQNLVLLDEAIIYNSSHLFGFFSVFNNDAVKDVQLYKGGIPARFGGRVSSVLDIRQKDGNSKTFGLKGGIGLISSRLTAEGPTVKGKGSFLVSGRASYAHLFLKLFNNNNKAGFYDLNFKTNFEANANNKLYLSGYFGNDNFKILDLFNNSYGNMSGNLRWNHIFNNKLFSNLSVIYSRYNYFLNIDFVGFDWNSNIQNYNLKYDMGYFLNDKIKLDFGVSSIYYDFNPGLLEPSKEDSPIKRTKLDDKFAFENAIYIGAEHKLSKHFTTQYGLRFSYFSRLGQQKMATYANDLPVVYNSKIGVYQRAPIIGYANYDKGEAIATFGNFEPRLAMSYKFDEKSSIKASYNRMAQYLHLISNTASAAPLDIWTPSGKYIKPQLGDQYAIGYFANIENNTYSLETETYYKTVKNRVDYIDGSDLIGQNNIESEILIGESKSYGWEILVRKNKGDLTGWLAYTISEAQQRTLGGKSGGPGVNKGKWYNTPYDRTHDISLTGNYECNDKWTFGANFAFQTGRPVTYPNGQFIYNGISIPSYAGRNEQRLPAYHRVDVSATLTSRKNEDRRWKTEWVFSVYNAYDRKNAASISFDSNVDTGTNEATKTAIFGIVPSVTYNFKF